jgi:hypothetical protein
LRRSHSATHLRRDPFPFVAIPHVFVVVHDLKHVRIFFGSESLVGFDWMVAIAVAQQRV